MGQPPHPPRRQRSAFTLVELMVVMVLVAIMSALILPEMAGTYADAKLKSTARRLITLCSLANSQAISHSQTQRIRFDQPSRRFHLETGPARTGTAGQRSRTPSMDLETAGEWDASIRLRILEQSEADAATPAPPGNVARPPRSNTPLPSSELSALTFYADGTSLARQISLEDASGARLVLTINPTTSRVRIADTRRP
ncbi:MAG: prepilin-type N-terminal cleavage/methylation domain-containing protein [Verrucomicrobiales bacterium]|nr:prepilin-type N-terminal cleavage/methylation domain-containing protein [Verrucomicrobiales bacterium]